MLPLFASTNPWKSKSFSSLENTLKPRRDTSASIESNSSLSDFSVLARHHATWHKWVLAICFTLLTHNSPSISLINLSSYLWAEKNESKINTSSCVWSVWTPRSNNSSFTTSNMAPSKKCLVLKVHTISKSSALHKHPAPWETSLPSNDWKNFLLPFSAFPNAHRILKKSVLFNSVMSRLIISASTLSNSLSASCSFLANDQTNSAIGWLFIEFISLDRNSSKKASNNCTEPLLVSANEYNIPDKWGFSRSQILTSPFKMACSNFGNIGLFVILRFAHPFKIWKMFS